jgi:type VI protein secretion system component Hcp
MANLHLLKLKFQSQGSVKGQSPASSGPTKAKIHLPGWRYSVAAQVDLHDIPPTGQRKHGSITPSKQVDCSSPGLFTITKQVDSASPLLLQAFHANTAFPEVLVQIISTGSGGKETIVETISLTNARISDVKHYMPSTPRHANTCTGGNTLAVYTFKYDRIKISDGNQSPSTGSKTVPATATENALPLPIPPAPAPPSRP